jgi:hypothetical protein
VVASVDSACSLAIVAVDLGLRWAALRAVELLDREPGVVAGELGCGREKAEAGRRSDPVAAILPEGVCAPQASC